MIAVANLKGGVGKTTLARNLAAVAKSLHLKSTFLYAEYPEARRRAGYVFYDLKPLNIDCPELSPEEILDYEPGDGEVVIVDVCNSIAQDSFLTASERDEPLKANPQGFLARFNPDIYLIPGEFASSLDNWGTQRLIESNVLQAPVQLLHRPSLMCMDFAATASQDGFDVTSQMFCPFFIPQSVSTSSPLPRDFMSEWQNLDQKHHHFRLFEHLLSQVGGELFESIKWRERSREQGWRNCSTGRRRPKFNGAVTLRTLEPLPTHEARSRAIPIDTTTGRVDPHLRGLTHGLLHVTAIRKDGR